MGRTEHEVTTPGFVVDHHSVTKDNGRQVDWASVPDSLRQGSFNVQLAAAAIVDATSLTVDALPEPVPAGTVLYFGPDKFARVTASAAKGATTLAVEALPTALADNDVAVVSGEFGKFVAAGTVMAEMTGGKIVPRANRPGAETSIGLLATNAHEDSRSDSLSGYGLVTGGMIYENLLPDATGSPAVLNSTHKTELQTAGVGTGFGWRQYSDDSAS